MIEPRKLTYQEYVNYLSQQFWLASQTEHIMYEAGRRCADLGLVKLARFFRKHGKDEAGHHIWAYEDLMACSEKIQPSNKATSDLIDWWAFEAIYRLPYSILGLSKVVENYSAGLTLEKIVPRKAIVMKACKFLSEHLVLDKIHAADVNNIIAGLTHDQAKIVIRGAALFEGLYDDFLMASIL